MNELQSSDNSRVKDLIVSFIEIASQCGCAMSIDEVALLLPQELELKDVREIVQNSPVISVSSGAEEELVVQKGYENLFSERPYKSEVSKRYLETAKTFIDELARKSPQVKLIGVCGSVAYGSATESDDIDIFFATKKHHLWLSFTKALLLARVFSIKTLIRGGKADFCFSYVQDEEHLEEEIMHRQTPLFAREFLSIRVHTGIDYYTALLNGAQWMCKMFPRLCNAKLTEGVGRSTSQPKYESRQVGILKAVNLFMYVVVRNYLMLKAFSLNLKYRKQHRAEDTFEVMITKGSCLYNSSRYRELEKMYKVKQASG